ncbi:DUF3783 domain-containing protein [Clostridium cellulovorans]|uniref:DUF3783 domain-containing protein n=1 Tax=Clostridium cellulovorans (strain ATCC 35296 / DSM 3052 / OCM 3 / 743B) TaxID=573061 RepID=D9SKW4_CLOC7|nr:DUF3783 domain-containing protein [Clostridium cellulovorans]ADL53536.1 hypothetical protein Clocel_3870 [Clostridium cellulovorans 743B]
MVKKQILLYGFNSKEVDQIRISLIQNRLPLCTVIDANMGNLKVGDILFGAKSNDEQNLPNNERVVLLNALDSNEMNKAIFQIRSKIKGRLPLFAMITEHNVKWEFKNLLDELLKERKYFQENGSAMKEHEEEGKNE